MFTSTFRPVDTVSAYGVRILDGGSLDVCHIAGCTDAPVVQEESYTPQDFCHKRPAAFRLCLRHAVAVRTMREQARRECQARWPISPAGRGAS